MSRRVVLVVVVLLALAAGSYLWWQSHHGERRTFILVSIDTLRPERLGLYGNTPDVSPCIDALGRQGVVFEQALANSPYTLPSHMTMLTGLDPVAHGVKRAGSTLPDRATTLAELLREDGFQCGAFTDGGFVAGGFGFSQGFHVYDDQRDTREEGAVNGFARIMPRALAWLDSHEDDDLFLFVHTFDVHAPYQTGDPEVLEHFRQRPVKDGKLDYELHRLGFMYQSKMLRIPEYGRMDELLNDYDAGVFEADRGVGSLLEWVTEHGRLDNAMVVVVSDHGESFADHGIQVGHGIGLTDDEIHIPLIMKLPHGAGAGRRIDGVVDLTDLAPTVLDVYGLKCSDEMEGDSLLALVRNQALRRDLVFGVSPNTESYFVVRGGLKFITPPMIPPMTVAQRHLGPTTPPDGGAGQDLGQEYTVGPPGSEVTLHYDTLGDPLGIRDTILDSTRLFDRNKDPRERTNLAFDAAGKPTKLTSDFAELTSLAIQHSQHVHAALADGDQPEIGKVHTDDALLALGYIGAGSSEDKEDLPRAIEEAIEHPYVVPDMRPLDEADKIMQYVRLSLRDGSPLPEGVPAAMQSLGDTLVGWAIENPTHSAQVGWRMNEVIQLAQQAGVTVDADRWVAKWRSWARKQAKGVAPQPVEAPPTQATDGSEQTEPPVQTTNGHPPADAPPPETPPAEEPQTDEPPAAPPAGQQEGGEPRR